MENPNKIVFLDLGGRMHSLYRILISNPPSGYNVITQGTKWDGTLRFFTQTDSLYSFQERYLQKLIPVNLFKAYLEKFKKPPQGTTLTYATGHLVFRKEPWIVDMEFVTQLAGYSAGHFKRYRRLIENMLASKYCKGIICWTQAGKRTILENMDCQRFKDKIEVVPLAVQKNDFIKDYKDYGKVRILFVGSANIPGEFEFKGGKEVLEAFTILLRKHPNLELVIRSDVPKEIKDRYVNINNLRIIDNIIPREQLDQEFKTADIFLFPSHCTPGLAILDAMSYELPVVTTDVWANSEMVEDGKTGFVIPKSENVQYYTMNFVPNWSYNPNSQFAKSINKADFKVVDEIVTKINVLIENPDIRRKMGEAGRWAVEKGKYSIESRNDKLKRIFDEAK